MINDSRSGCQWYTLEKAGSNNNVSGVVKVVDFSKEVTICICICIWLSGTFYYQELYVSSYPARFTIRKLYVSGYLANFTILACLHWVWNNLSHISEFFFFDLCNSKCMNDKKSVQEWLVRIKGVFVGWLFQSSFTLLRCPHPVCQTHIKIHPYCLVGTWCEVSWIALPLRIS